MQSHIPRQTTCIATILVIAFSESTAVAQQLYGPQPYYAPQGAPAMYPGSYTPAGPPPAGEPNTTDPGVRDVEVTVYGKGGVRTDLTNFDQASQFNGGLGASVLVHDRHLFTLAIDGTAVTLLLQSADTRRFAAAVVNTQLGPYSLTLDARFERLFGPIGLYFYGRASSSRWQFADSPEDAAQAPIYNVVTYGAGFGASVSIRVRPKTPKGNDFSADAGLGLALRGIGGDITLDNRHAPFLNSTGVVFLAPELKTSLQFNALQLSGSFFYFPAGGIEGLSGARLLIGVGAIGDLIHL